MSVNILNKQTRELEPIAGVPIGKLNLLEKKTNNIANDTDVYSEQKSYSVGDYIIYDNVVYKCITACSAAAWSVNESCFEETTLTSAVTTLNSDLNDIKNSTTYTRLFKIGKMVFYQHSEDINNTASGERSTTLSATIPVGYRPSGDIWLELTARYKSIESGGAVVKANGAINATITTASNATVTWITVSGIWEIA